MIRYLGNNHQGRWSWLLLAGLPAAALAQPPEPGSITFSPLTPAAIPTAGGALLLLLGIALAIVAVRRLRISQSRLAGLALMSGALVLAASGTTLIQRVTADIGLQIVNAQGTTTFELQADASNVFINESGIAQQVSSLTLPDSCPGADTPVDGVDSACLLGSTVANSASCSVDCRADTGLAAGRVMRVDGSTVDVEFVPCGEGTTNCTADAARQACETVGKRVVSHASDGSSSVYSLGATQSCQWSIGYYNSDQDLPEGACLAGVSNLDWTSCCGPSDWHGNTVPFPEAGTAFGYVDPGNSGYFADQPNSGGASWGCQDLNSPAATISPTCTSHYVACTGAADPG